MGKVYAAQHPRLPRQDALKILSPALSADPVFRIRFEREAQLAAGLEHPHIVPVFDCGDDNGRLWISMRLIHGPTGASLLRDSPGGLPPEEVVQICQGVARALDFAHSRTLLHRDVKPENILIDHSTDMHQVMLTDFGVARLAGDPALTATGMVFGTVDYCSPEQLNGADCDGRSDQYSLACSAALLLTGVKPFAAPAPSAVMLRHLQPERPSIFAARPSLSPRVDEVFGRALALDPADRYQTCIEFADALAGALRTVSTVKKAAPAGDPARVETLVNPNSAQTLVTPQRPGPADPAYSETMVTGLPPTAPHSGPAFLPRNSGPHNSGPQNSVPDGGSRPAYFPPQPPPPVSPHHISPRPMPPHPMPPRPAPPRRKTAAIVAAAVVMVIVLVGGTIGYLTFGGSSDDDTATAPALTNAPSDGASPTSEAQATAPNRQQYDILDAGRGGLNPCSIPANLLVTGGMNAPLKALPRDAEILLCEGTFTGNAPGVLMGGYVAGTETANWVIAQYDRGAPAFDDLPGWRRYDATDRERPITRCKYGFVSSTTPRYAFEVTAVRSAQRGGFDARARAAACNRLADVARSIDPAMPQLK